MCTAIQLWKTTGVMALAVVCATAAFGSAITEALAPYQEAENVPGIVSAVWNNKTKKLYVDTCGYSNVATKKPISENDVFWIASMTKGFTVAMILQLVDKGVIKLDDKVVKWIPEWKDIKVWKNYGNEKEGLKDDPNTQLITIRHLLCHRAGLDDVQYPINSWTCKAQTEYYIQHGCRYAPNTVFGYTNGGLEVAAYICEIATGKSYPELMKEYVFDPLGLENTTFAPTVPKADMPHVYHITSSKGENFCNDQGGHGQIKYDEAGLVQTTGYSAGGGLFSTVPDLVKFYRFVANHGVTVEGNRLISEQTFKEWTLESDYWKTHKKEYTTGKPHGNYSLGMYVSDKVPCQIGHEGFCCTYGYSLWDSGSCRIYLVQLFTKQYNETYTARKAALEAAVDQVLAEDEPGGGDEPPSSHVHVWTEGTRVEPTCTKDGSVVSNCTGTGTCELGGAKTAPLLRLGHDWSAWAVTTPPQVGVKGVETRSCRRTGCGAVETHDVDPLPEPEPTPEPGTRVPTEYGYRLTSVVGGVTNVASVFTNVTKSWNWTVPDGVTNVDCLVVGGGGGGGGNYGGGGGAGGLVSRTGVTCASGEIFTVRVGVGGKGGASKADGTGTGEKGTLSSIANAATDFLVEALGGGGGGSLRGAGSSGGSGGGAGGSCSGVATTCKGGAGTAGQGHDGGTVPDTGYSGCGGGGATGAGAVPKTKEEAGEYYGGAGGAGLASSISGESVTYAEGGKGGGKNESGPAGLDGRGFGGGGGKSSAAGTRGGNGVVVIRYAVSGGDEPGGGDEPPVEPPVEPTEPDEPVGPAVGETWGWSNRVTVAGVDCCVLAFTNTAATHSWKVPSGVTNLKYLVVGGGGGGGVAGNARGGGGGGAGGFLSDDLAVTPGGLLSVTVGKGGAAGKPGSSSFFGSLEAWGGGAGNSGEGASGGGAQGWSNVAGGVAKENGAQGFPGCPDAGQHKFGGGGGGGAASAGVNGTASSNNGTAGGAGKSSDITGESVVYAAGGGGGAYDNSRGTAGAGGSEGVGGRGGSSKGSATAGQTATGSGGGGGAYNLDGNAGAAGADGIVIVRYAVPAGEPAAETAWTEPEGDSPEAVRKALAEDGFGETVQSALATRADYEAFKAYCVGTLGLVDPQNGAQAGVRANALLGYALGAKAVPETPIESDDVSIAAVERSASGVGVVVGVKVEGFDPNDAAAVESALQKVVDAIGGAGVEAMSRDGVSVASKVENGGLTVTVTPKDAASGESSFFVRVVIRN